MKKSAKIRKRATFLAAFALMLLLIATLPTVAYASDDVTPNDPHAKETDTAIISMSGGEYSVRTNDNVLKGASLSQLISATERDGMELVFDNVTSYENLSICKNVTLSGNLTSYGTVTLSSNRAVLS